MIFFQTLEKTFNHVSLFVLSLVYLPWNLVCLLTRNTRIGTFSLYQAQKFSRAVSLICHNYCIRKGNVFQQTRCNFYVVDIACTQKQFQRSAIFLVLLPPLLFPMCCLNWEFDALFLRPNRGDGLLQKWNPSLTLPKRPLLSALRKSVQNLLFPAFGKNICKYCSN